MSRKMDELLLIIKRVDINNFNVLENCTIEINDGELVVITGKNGSGKTSVAEAIKFCLTGKGMRGLPTEDLIMKGKKETSVVITARYGNRKLLIKRTRNKKTSKLVIKEVIDEQEVIITDAKEFLEEIITETMFQKTNYLNHQIDTFIRGGNKETSEMLDKLFSIFSINKIISSINTNKLDKKIAVIDARIQEKNETIEIIKKKVKQRNINEIKSELNDKQNKRTFMKEELSNTNTSIDENKIRLEDVKNEMKEKVNLKNNYNALQSRSSLMSDNLASIKKKITSIKKKLKVITSSKEEEDLHETLDKLNNEIITLKSEMKFWEQFPMLVKLVIKQFTDENKCPFCYTDGMKSTVLKNLNKQKHLVPENIERLSNEIMEKNNKSNSIKKKMEKITELETLVNKYEDEKKELEASLASLDDEISTLNPPDNNELNDYENDMSHLDEIVSSLIEKRASIKAKIEILNDSINKLEEEMKMDEKDDDVKNTMEEIESLSRKMKKLSSKMQILKNVRNGYRMVLNNVRERIMDDINPMIMQKINSYGNGSITDFKIIPMKKIVGGESRYRYAFEVHLNTEKLPFEALSTGQKSLILLSIILTLFEVTSSSLPLIILDEIDNVGIDKENLRLVLKEMIELARHFNIVFIDRHDDTITDIKNIINELNSVNEDEDSEISARIYTCIKDKDSMRSTITECEI